MRSTASRHLLLALVFVAACGPVVARGQGSLWEWGTGARSDTAWSPEQFADYLGTGQTPHPAVARIVAPERSGTSMGTGVLVDVNRTQGLVLTNWHVIRSTRSAVLVQFPDGFQSAGTVVRFDEPWDLAAIAIWKPNALPISLAPQPPQVGEALTIAGYGRGAFRPERQRHERRAELLPGRQQGVYFPGGPGLPSRRGGQLEEVVGGIRRGRYHHDGLQPAPPFRQDKRRGPAYFPRVGQRAAAEFNDRCSHNGFLK